MKIKKKMFQLFMALSLCFTGLMGNNAVIFAADTFVDAPNTLNMDIKRLNGGTLEKIDVSNGYAISDLDNGRLVITYQAHAFTQGNTLTLTLPYFYSFNKIDSTSFYTDTKLSGVNNGVDNQLVLTMNDDISNKANPETVSFDFSIKINRNSITKEKENQWNEKTWFPNQEARDFIVEHNSNDPNISKITNTLDIVSKPYTSGMTSYLALSTLDSADGKTVDIAKDNDFSYGQNISIWQEGGGFRGGDNSKMINYMKLSYQYPDIYTYEPTGYSQVTYEATLPENFEFGNYEPNDFAKDHASVTISSDKRTATIKVNDYSSSSANVDRIISGLEIKAVEDYRTGKKKFPANTPYTVGITATDRAGNSISVTEKTITTVDYSSQNLLTYLPSGDKDATTGNVISKLVEPKEKGTLNPGLLKNNREVTRDPDTYKEISSYGNNVSITQKYDENLKVSSLKLANETEHWNYTSYLSKSKWKSYTYSTNKRTNIVVPLSDATTMEHLVMSDPDEYITSVRIDYSDFAYIASMIPFREINYSITEKNITTNTEWQANDEIAITTSLKDDKDNLLKDIKSYVRIKGLQCPPLTMGADPVNKTLGVGEYSNNENVISGALYLNTPYVGTPLYEDKTPSSAKTVYTDVLENPVFTVGAYGGYAGIVNSNMNKIYESIITNGKVNFSSIMGDGKWKVILKTQNAKGAKEGSALKEYQVDLPSFAIATQLDFIKLANIPDDEYIVWFQMKHTGNLDISSLSNYYTDADPINGKAVDKTFFTVENTNHDISPLSGQYNNGNMSSNSFINNYVHVTFDNCSDVDHRHEPSKKGYQVDEGWTNATRYASKGAELITFNYGGENKIEGTIQQGAMKTLTVNYTPSADVSSSEAKLMSKGSESFYYQLGKDAIKYLSFGKVSVDGLAASSEIVTINGKMYLKITNSKRNQYEKKIIKEEFYNGERSRATFEPYKITIDTYALPTTPTKTTLNIFTGKNDSNNDLGTFIEWNDTAYQEYTDASNRIIRNAVSIFGQNKLGSGANAFSDMSQAWQEEFYVTKDDYAGLYKNTPASERHFMTYVNGGYSIAPNVQALQGIVLNPGVKGNNQEASIQVKPWDEKKLTTSLSAIAGQSEQMKKLSSTITLPRKGEIITDGANQYKSDVSLYLSGPIKENIAFNDPASTKPIIRYSMDGGTTFVDESQILDWSKVSDFSIYVETIEIGDGCTYTIEMESDGSDQNLGNSYMEAVFKTSNLNSQSNRMNTYEFIGYRIEGTTWDDTNKDGMIDASEPKLSSSIELYQNYGKDNEKLIATTTADANGAYEFTDLTMYKNMTVITDLPSKKTTTIVTASTDNKFTANGSGKAVYTFPTIKEDQINVSYGIRELEAVTLGGADTATAITGKKTISGSKENTDIIKDEYTFNIIADVNNPMNGTENIPTTVTNDVGTASGANVSFTGITGWTFTKEGTFHFTLNEVDPASKGHTYDQSSYEVTIVVSEKKENGISTGKLQQTTTITKDGTNIAISDVNFANIAKVYKINYDTNGGQPPLISSKTKVNWNDKNLLPANDPTRTGYTFAGWEVKTTSRTISSVTNEDTYATLAQDDDTKTEITLKAKWTKKEYQVTWVSEDTTHGTLTPDNASEHVQYKEFAKIDIIVTPNVSADQWSFTGWEYNYLPDGAADVPTNYIKGVTQNYKDIEVEGNIVFTAKFAKKPFVNVDSEHGYVAINDGTTLPVIPDDIANKKTNAKIEYDESNTDAKSVAIAFENQRHYHLKKVTISDLYGNTKVIYTNQDGESADTEFQMKDSKLNINFSTTGSLMISNIKNSLHARFTFEEDPKYNVYFYTQSVEDVTDTTLPYISNEGLYSGDAYGTKPAVDPIKEGYRFSGWSSDGINIDYKETDKITNKDVKMYAIWEQKSYSVKYNLNGGYYNIATSIPDYITTFTGAGLIPSDAPRKDGYMFEGWYYNGIKIKDTMKYKELVADDMVNSVTLSAKWKANTYQVLFDKNADKATGSMEAQSYSYGEKKVLSSNNFIRAGYTFAGWATSADGNVTYADGDAVENLTKENDGKVKLYAIWNANGNTAYKVEHYKQQKDGTWKNTPSEVVNMSGRSDSEANAKIKTASDVGYENYIFDTNNTDNVVKGNIEADGSLVLKVYYREVLEVTFDVNGGMPEIAQQRVIYGNKAVKPEKPVKEGYTFIGWNNVADNEQWDFDDEIKSTMTLKAKWEKVETTITPVPPTTPEQPVKPGQPTSPKTGDTTSVMGTLILSGVSLMGFIVALKRKKRLEE